VKTLIDITETRTQQPAGMSNMDHSIDDGCEAGLRSGGTYCQHSAWNFCGYVWFEDDRFHEQVWVHHSLRAEFSADTLADLMRDVNAEYGSD
jgi:hypothetical protein